MDPNLPQNRSLGYYNLNDAAKQAEPMIENAIQNCLKDYGGALLTAQRAKIDNYVQQLGDRVNTSAGQYGLLRILQEYNIAAQQMGQPVFDTNLIAQYMKSQKVTLTKSNVGDSVNWYITKADGGRFDDGSIIKPVMKEAVTMNPYQKGQLTLRTADLKEKQRHNLASEANARNRTAAAWYSATHKSLGGGGGGHSGGNSSKGGADSRISAASCTISSSTRPHSGTASLCPQQWRRGPTRGGRKVYENGKELNTFLNDDSGVRFTPEALGESGGYRPIESDSSSYGRTVDEALGDKEPAQGAYEPEPEPQPREVNTGSEYDAEINQAAAEYGVDPVLAHAVAQAESQHGKSTSNVFGVDGVSDPHQSIRIGVKSLKRCIDDNGGDVRKGLREYNGSDAGGTPDYDDRVLNIANEYGGLGSAGGGAGGDAYSVGASAWMGARMPNGANGCVDAVVRIGSYYDPFLKDEADKGVASVPRLVDDARAAGKQVIDFDPNALEKGDTIVYGDNDHVVTYDGNGGYVGNSTGLGKVVHGGDYTQMGGLIEDAEGNTTRWTQSNNPQWYQDAYAKLGRAPKKSELPGIAEENLLKEQEFYERDQILNKLKDLREQLKKNPDADYESLLRGDGTPIGSSVKPIESEARLEEPPKSNEPANVEERSGDVR